MGFAKTPWVSVTLVHSETLTESTNIDSIEAEQTGREGVEGGSSEGSLLGANEGLEDGSSEGSLLGANEGLEDGSSKGSLLGANEGSEDGSSEGSLLGAASAFVVLVAVVIGSGVVVLVASRPAVASRAVRYITSPLNQ